MQSPGHEPYIRCLPQGSARGGRAGPSRRDRQQGRPRPVLVKTTAGAPRSPRTRRQGAPFRDPARREAGVVRDGWSPTGRAAMQPLVVHRRTVDRQLTAGALGRIHGDVGAAQELGRCDHLGARPGDRRPRRASSTSRPATVNDAENSSSTRVAMRATASSPGLSWRTTANSSPPSRAMSSRARRPLRSRSATSRRMASPAS